MSRSEEEDICGEPYKSKEGVCTNEPTARDGKCGFHTNIDNPYEKHGLYASNYYESRSEEGQNFIDSVADDLLEKSYYTPDDTSMVEKCRQIAIDLHQKRRADGYIGRKGLTQESTVGFHEQYGEITETQENTLFITKDRLSRESRLSMKDLGILDQEGEETDDSSSLIESLSEDMK